MEEVFWHAGRNYGVSIEIFLIVIVILIVTHQDEEITKLQSAILANAGQVDRLRPIKGREPS